jgi:hypothetical protein
MILLLLVLLGAAAVGQIVLAHRSHPAYSGPASPGQLPSLSGSPPPSG